MGINYGFDKVRFMSPVKTGTQVRARFVLNDAEIRPSGRVVFHYGVTVEIEQLKNQLSLLSGLLWQWLERIPRTLKLFTCFVLSRLCTILSDNY